MKQVLYMFEGVGVYTKGIKTKEEAVKLMREDAFKEFNLYKEIDYDNWECNFSFHPSEITEETVKEARYYKHKECDIETVGYDNTCYECGESLDSGGRKCFAFLI